MLVTLLPKVSRLVSWRLKLNLGSLVAAYRGLDGRTNLELHPHRFQSYALHPNSVIVGKVRQPV